MTEDLHDLESRCESEFERLVLRRIIARGYRRLRVAHSVGRFRIDMVVEGPQSRLAIECDGDQWHGEEQWHQDRARQAILERAGWTFERIRGSDFFRNPDNALASLWSRLEELGIQTGDEWLSHREQTTVLEVTGAPTEREHAAASDRPIPTSAFGQEQVPAGSLSGVRFGARSFGPSAAEVREWSRASGLPVGDRGRLHPDITEAWNRTHPNRRYGSAR